jgi:pyruvate dehydrogenase E2 component (dihydrolipoamide acetyltransferase)
MAQPIVMPSLGMFTAEGTLTAWLRPPGAPVAADEPVAEITTEKTTQEIVAPAAGILHQVAAIGTNLPIQGLIGYVLAENEPPPAAPPDAERVRRGDAEKQTVPLPASPRLPISAPGEVGGGEVRASPIARRLAADNSIDLATLVGSGPGGRIVEADVQAAIARKTATPEVPTVPARRVRERIPLIGMRRTIAERLRASLSAAAPVTLTREVAAETFVAARDRLNARLEASVPFDALFVKLFATALRERPQLNAVIEGDAILVLDEVHVGFAVAVAEGLIVPVVRDADRRSLAEIAASVRELGERARANRLRIEDVSGGTATITNLGAHGVDAFTPIINPPQSAILGIGRIQARPVVRDGQFIVGTTCVLSLTFDHRVADGVPAAQLLDVVARQMNDAQYLDSLG